MNTIDTRVLETSRGLEVYLDVIGNVEVSEIHSPTSDNYFYEIILGINYFLLGEKKYYANQKHYFGITMSDDYNTITLRDPDTESLFAVKTAAEKQATKELIGDWLIETEAFKQAVSEMIKQEKDKDVQTEEDIKAVLGTIKFLDKLSEFKRGDLEEVSIEGENV